MQAWGLTLREEPNCSARATVMYESPRRSQRCGENPGQGKMKGICTVCCQGKRQVRTSKASCASTEPNWLLQPVDTQIQVRMQLQEVGARGGIRQVVGSTVRRPGRHAAGGPAGRDQALRRRACRGRSARSCRCSRRCPGRRRRSAGPRTWRRWAGSCRTCTRCRHRAALGAERRSGAEAAHACSRPSGAVEGALAAHGKCTTPAGAVVAGMGSVNGLHATQPWRRLAHHVLVFLSCSGATPPNWSTQQVKNPQGLEAPVPQGTPAGRQEQKRRVPPNSCGKALLLQQASSGKLRVWHLDRLPAASHTCPLALHLRAAGWHMEGSRQRGWVPHTETVAAAEVLCTCDRGGPAASKLTLCQHAVPPTKTSHRACGLALTGRCHPRKSQSQRRCCCWSALHSCRRRC